MNKRLPKLKTDPWSYHFTDTYLELKEHPFLIPKYSIKIDETLNFTITIFNWPLPEDHQNYLNQRRSLHNVFVSPLLQEVSALFLCLGVTKAIDSSKLQIDENEPYPSTSWEMHRAAGCFLLNSASRFSQYLCEYV